MTSIKTTHFKGIVFRAHKPFRASTPLSGEGTSFHGGRFNPKGIAALYTALEQTTAFAEHQQGFLHRPQPTTLCAYEVDCADIVNLTNPDILKTLNIRESELSCPWELIVENKKTPPSWRLAKKLIGESVAGIIVPSFTKNAHKNSKNLVLWHWGSTLPHKVIVIDDENRLAVDSEI